MPLDFSGVFSNAGIGLEQQATGAFGQAVDQFTRQPLTSMFGSDSAGIGDDLGGAPNPYIYGEWNGTNYASDLIRFQPKHHFMFRVLFELDTSFLDLLPQRKNVFQYVIKRISRPKVTYEYEPVNFYNFKSQVLKTSHYEPLNITLIDDIQDTFHNFVRGYHSAFSPLTRTWNSTQQVTQLEQGGFNFSDPGNIEYDSAIRGVLKDGKTNPLKSIKIIQYYGHASAENTFTFINPRILDIEYDEIHHEPGTDGNHATMRFDYDGLIIENTEPVFGRSQYAVPGKDMYSNVRGDISGGDPLLGGFGNSILGNAFGSFLSGSTNLFGGILQNTAMSQLAGINNPILSNAMRNVSLSGVNQLTGGVRSSLFSSFGVANPAGSLFNSPSYTVINSGTSESQTVNGGLFSSIGNGLSSAGNSISSGFSSAGDSIASVFED